PRRSCEPDDRGQSTVVFLAGTAIHRTDLCRRIFSRSRTAVTPSVSKYRCAYMGHPRAVFHTGAARDRGERCTDVVELCATRRGAASARAGPPHLPRTWRLGVLCPVGRIPAALCLTRVAIRSALVHRQSWDTVPTRSTRASRALCHTGAGGSRTD